MIDVNIFGTKHGGVQTCSFSVYSYSASFDATGFQLLTVDSFTSVLMLSYRVTLSPPSLCPLLPSKLLSRRFIFACHIHLHCSAALFTLDAKHLGLLQLEVRCWKGHRSVGEVCLARSQLEQRSYSSKS